MAARRIAAGRNYRKRSSLLVLFALPVLVGWASWKNTEVKASDRDPSLKVEESKSVVIQFKDSYDLGRLPLQYPSQAARGRDIAQRLEAFTLQKIKSLPLFSSKGIESIKVLWLVNAVQVKGAASLIEQLSKQEGWGNIESTEPVRRFPVEELKDLGISTFRTNSWITSFGWGVEKIRAPEVWNPKTDVPGVDGKGVLVAVIDSGVNITHPDLSPNVWKNSGEIGLDSMGKEKAYNGTDDDKNGYIDDVYGWNTEENLGNVADYHGHGTQSAGVVLGAGTLGTQTGVAPKASLMSIRACCNLTGEISEVAMLDALQYALRNGAQVISQSLSIKHFSKPTYAKWRRASDVLLAARIVHVNSAGNRGAGNEPHNIGAPGTSPPPWLHASQTQGALGSVITVGAANPDDQVRAYSSVGPVTWQDITEFQDYPYEEGKKPGLLKPDVCAPSEVPSTSKDGESYTARFGGTSSATPHVAGVVALLLSKNPQLSPAQITEALQMTAVLVEGKFNNKCGAGRVDAFAALQYVSRF